MYLSKLARKGTRLHNVRGNVQKKEELEGGVSTEDYFKKKSDIQECGEGRGRGKDQGRAGLVGKKGAIEREEPGSS